MWSYCSHTKPRVVITSSNFYSWADIHSKFAETSFEVIMQGLALPSSSSCLQTQRKPLKQMLIWSKSMPISNPCRNGLRALNPDTLSFPGVIWAENNLDKFSLPRMICAVLSSRMLMVQGGSTGNLKWLRSEQLKYVGWKLAMIVLEIVLSRCWISWDWSCLARFSSDRDG